MIRRRTLLATLLLPAILHPVLMAQVALHPTSVEPAAWERFALRVVNQSDVPVVAVRIEIPEALIVLGVDAPVEWTESRVPATEATPQVVEWRGGPLLRGEFREFPFFARLPADARHKVLVFPVRLTREDGTSTEWNRGAAGAPLSVRIRETTRLSARGAFALAGAALGLAALAVALSLFARRTGP